MQLTHYLRYGIVPSDIDAGATIIDRQNVDQVLELTNETVKVVEGADGLIYELHNSDELFLVDVHSHYDEDKLALKGRIKRGPQNCCEVVTGHIDIAFFDPDGYLIEAFSTWYKPRNIPRTGFKSSGFKGWVAEQVPQGSTVKIAYHSENKYVSAKSANGKLNCSENKMLSIDNQNDE